MPAGPSIVAPSSSFPVQPFVVVEVVAVASAAAIAAAALIVAAGTVETAPAGSSTIPA